jgi:hypothetical protein
VARAGAFPAADPPEPGRVNGGWLEAPAQALGYPFRTFIGGHLTRLGTRDDVVIQQEYVADLKAQAASAIDTSIGADVYTLPNAYQLVESPRIDDGHLGAFGIHP